MHGVTPESGGNIETKVLCIVEDYMNFAGLAAFYQQFININR